MVTELKRLQADLADRRSNQLYQKASKEWSAGAFPPPRNMSVDRLSRREQRYLAAIVFLKYTGDDPTLYFNTIGNIIYCQVNNIVLMCLALHLLLLRVGGIQTLLERVSGLQEQSYRLKFRRY